MPNTIQLVTYKELDALSDVDLKKCAVLASEQLNKAVKQGEDTLRQAQIYQLYENELAKRKFKQRIR
ncbi:MAG: hypothetical protein H0X30_02470 [Anaerolineae bacterium]|nr:hypothetical protein [Anaerolineae bacterium]